MAYNADKKPLDLTALTSLATDDTFIVGDTSDTSEVVKTITKSALITDLSTSFATAAQGAKADSAQQPPAEGAFVDGDKTKLDSAIQPGDLATVATSGDYNDLSNKPDLSVYDSFDQYADLASFPATGDADVVYVAQDTGYIYRWTGSTYAQMSAELALGETSATAYRGDRGKIAYDHTSVTTGNPHNVTKSDVGLGSVPNTDFTSAVAANTAKVSATATSVGSINAAATSKTTPVDADSFPIVDSEASNVIKRLTFTNLKAFLKTYFDSVTTTLTNKTLTDAKIVGAINAQTGTSYTLVLTDASKTVTMSNASANTLTVPPNASVAFPTGTRLMVQQLGAGATTIAAGAGVTINAPATVTLAIDETYESRGLLKTDVNTWTLI